MKHAVELTLDSGAFSSWKKGKPIELTDYINFIRRWKPFIHQPVNLDVIPGRYGRFPRHNEVEDSARLGFENLLSLRRAGISAMPVFHQGERFYWLEKMIGEGENYIGLSPTNTRSQGGKAKWLDEVFDFLSGTSGYPVVRLHGFGLTSLRLMYRYPWFSVDGSSWAQYAMYSYIVVPVKGTDGNFDYSDVPFTVKMTARKKNAYTFAYTSMGSRMQGHVHSFLDSIGMYDTISAREDYYWRKRACARFFREVSRRHVPRPWQCRRVGFSRTQQGFAGRTEPYGKLKVIFVSNSTHENEILQEERIRERLVSYAYCNDRSDLKTYVTTGLWPSPKKKHA